MMPKLVKWEQCCGCAACANKCSKHAITMQPNHEGFLHPVVDASLCIECGACEKVCPGCSIAQNIAAEPKVFIMQHKDNAVRYQSTSGGAFSAIAEEVIRRGGVVFGAVMSDDLTVMHDFVTDIDGLAKFRNSKYVQSAIGMSYLKAKEFLDEGRYVCFSGTPCQINGLYKYLGKDYEYLIAVDVVCKSVPSPLVFKRYIEFKSEQEGAISDVVFRDKKRGFLYCTMAHYKMHQDRLVSKDIYRKGSESDEWLRLFLSGKISRHSCMTCSYQTLHRVGDFTLGDIWETGNLSFDDNKGTTLVYIWTQKGKNFLNNIEERVRLKPYSIANSRGVERTNTIRLHPNRNQLFEDAISLSKDAFFAKYAPYNIKIRAKEIGRYLIWLFHLHNIVRHAKHMIIHR